MAETEDIYREFAEFYDLYVGDGRGDLPFYVKQAEQTTGPILEVGAGSGRLTIPIARAGSSVMAVDISEAMLDRLRQRLQDEPQDVQDRVRLTLSDMCDLNLGETYGLVIVPFYTFNYLLTPGDQRRALSALRRHLAADGRLVIDVFLPLGRISSCPTEPVRRVQNVDLRTGKTLRGWNVYEIDPESQIETRHHQFEIVRPNGTVVRKEFVTRRRYSFPVELNALFTECGLEVKEMLTGCDEASTTGGSERLIYVLTHRSDPEEAESP